MRGGEGRGTVTGLLLGTVVVGSAVFTGAVGQRGLFALDQSILFDGGWRVLCGQVPFREFVAPVGPVAFWIQGALFGLFGVSWSGYLASAALLNGVAVVLAFGIARTLLPEERWAPLLAAAGTGVGFLPPSGTPWIDAMAFLPGLAAVLALLGTGERSPEGRQGDWRREGWAAVAGVLLVAAFLTKQSAALAVGPAVVGVLLATPRPEGTRGRRNLLLGLAAGMGAGTLAFAGWLTLVAEPDLFLRHVFRIPATEGWGRLLEAPGRSLVTLLTGMGPRPVRGVLLLAMVPAGIVLARSVAAQDSPPSRTGVRTGAGGRGGIRRLAVVAAGLFLGQNLFLATANNQPEISLPFAGLVVALGVRIGWEGLERGRGRTAVVRWGGGVLLAGLIAVFFVRAANTAWSREVHEALPPGAHFHRPLATGGLAALRWGEPTLLLRGGVPTGVRRESRADPGPVPVPAASVEALVAELRRRGEPFFVFPDWTLLYGVVGTPSPQPLLWFHPGLTYPADGDPDLDRWIVAALRDHDVRVLVLEEVSWFGTPERLADFPALAAWIDRCFREADRIGPFHLRVRESTCAAGAPPTAAGRRGGGGRARTAVVTSSP